jgi:antitoxin HigA-1
MEDPMAVSRAGKRFPGRKPTHPGAILRLDVLPALGLSVTVFAGRLGISRQTLHGILNEKQAVTPEMAARIGRLLGKDPGLWLRMRQAHDLWVAEHELAAELASITPLPQLAASI